jgi:hypothetical protein
MIRDQHAQRSVAQLRILGKVVHDSLGNVDLVISRDSFEVRLRDAEKFDGLWEYNVGKGVFSQSLKRKQLIISWPTAV